MSYTLKSKFRLWVWRLSCNTPLRRQPPAKGQRPPARRPNLKARRNLALCGVGQSLNATRELATAAPSCMLWKSSPSSQPLRKQTAAGMALMRRSISCARGQAARNTRPRKAQSAFASPRFLFRSGWQRQPPPQHLKSSTGASTSSTTEVRSQNRAPAEPGLATAEAAFNAADVCAKDAAT